MKAERGLLRLRPRLPRQGGPQIPGEGHVYSENLAGRIIVEVLGERFPNPTTLPELQALLPEFSTASRETWLTTIDGLHRDGQVDCKILRSGIGAIAIQTVGTRAHRPQRSAPALSHEASALRIHSARKEYAVSATSKPSGEMAAMATTTISAILNEFRTRCSEVSSCAARLQEVATFEHPSVLPLDETSSALKLCN